VLKAVRHRSRNSPASIRQLTDVPYPPGASVFIQRSSIANTTGAPTGGSRERGRRRMRPINRAGGDQATGAVPAQAHEQGG
jgi:hypothetical protein